MRNVCTQNFKTTAEKRSEIRGFSLFCWKGVKKGRHKASPFGRYLFRFLFSLCKPLNRLLSFLLFFLLKSKPGSSDVHTNQLQIIWEYMRCSKGVEFILFSLFRYKVRELPLGASRRLRHKAACLAALFIPFPPFLDSRSPWDSTINNF